MVQWFCLISWSGWWAVVIIGILFHVIQRFASLNVCGSMTYMSWSSDFVLYLGLFDGWMLYWRYWFSETQTLALNYICRSVTYISWFGDFALYLENYMMDKCHNWNIGSVWCKDLPNKMNVGQWHTFHGPVILSYILMFWWRNVVLKILCDFESFTYFCL